MLPFLTPPDLDVPMGRLNYAHCVLSTNEFMNKALDSSAFETLDYVYLQVIIHDSCKTNFRESLDFLRNLKK